MAGLLERITRARRTSSARSSTVMDRIAGPERVGFAVGAVGPVGHRLLPAPPGAALAATAPARRPPGSEPSTRASPPDTTPT
ncbi:hypothetical protein ABT033_30165 [Streptomyces pharetrae]|uniref:hypothetical protein n=1 Tax=Streptomyces pharetrae TaxID=291370 RepID=UPI00334F345B